MAERRRGTLGWQLPERPTRSCGGAQRATFETPDDQIPALLSRGPNASWLGEANSTRSRSFARCGSQVPGCCNAQSGWVASSLRSGSVADCAAHPDLLRMEAGVPDCAALHSYPHPLTSLCHFIPPSGFQTSSKLGRAFAFGSNRHRMAFLRGTGTNIIVLIMIPPCRDFLNCPGSDFRTRLKYSESGSRRDALRWPCRPEGAIAQGLSNDYRRMSTSIEIIILFLEV